MKITKLFLMASFAALALVSCNNKPATQTPATDKDKQEEGGGKQEEQAVLAVDGKFDEWKDVAEIAGSDAVICVKAQKTDAKFFFYIEVSQDEMDTERVPYANYLSLYFDCGVEQDAKPITYWGDGEGTTYNKVIQIWLMSEGSNTMANWADGFAGKAKVQDGVYKAEFCFDRVAPLNEKKVYFGAHLTNQTVEKDESGKEVWVDGEDIGFAPYADEEMAEIK